MVCLYIVIPCFNEEEVIRETARRLSEKFEELNYRIEITSRIVFVNDGSKDKTWEIIKELHKENPIFTGINLSCNRGHQNALLAGLLSVKEKCDCVISMDADLQDDIGAINKMLDEYESGYDIVYGVRSKRLIDTWFKRFTAESFYVIMKKLGGDVIYNHADYRLMSKRAVQALSQFKEVNLFLRGIVPMIGYPSSIIYYERCERFAGKSKYPLRKMLSFAFEGITSLSIKPIRFITLIGGVIFIISILMLSWSMIGYFNGITIRGWASVMVSIWGIGGLLLLGLGIVGEYIGKIYLETKARPRFLVEEFLDRNEE